MAQSTKSSNITSYVDNNNFNPERYLQDTNAHFVSSNLSSNNNNHTSIEDVLDLTNLPVHLELRNISATAAFSGNEQNNYLHDDIKLSRNLPEYETKTNRGDQRINKNIQHENNIELQRNMPMNSFVSNPTARGFSDHGSRDAYLAPKIQPGGFSVPAQIPMQGRMQNVIDNKESEKSRINKMIMQNMQNSMTYFAYFTYFTYL